MIVTKLAGGLGNQMFQYAAGKRLALHHSVPLQLDLSAYDNQPANETPRHYELDCFKLKADVATDLNLPATGRLSRITQKLHGAQTLNVLSDGGFKFNRTALDAPDETLLVGYWQCEKYFVDTAKEIRADFTLNSPLAGKNAELAKQIKAVNSISLHVRRSDYVTNEDANKFHGLQPLDYYKAAIEMLAKKTRNPHFFVISDDPDWCKQNLKFDYQSTFIDHNPPDKGYEDMRLMSLCKHNIIANSSFSWWGAWLNANPQKIVIGPKRWLTDLSIDTSDVIPEGWIKL